MNPPIPIQPCFACGKPTNETQSIYGIGCMKCYQSKKPTRFLYDSENLCQAYSSYEIIDITPPSLEE